MKRSRDFAEKDFINLHAVAHLGSGTFGSVDLVSLSGSSRNILEDTGKNLWAAKSFSFDESDDAEEIDRLILRETVCIKPRAAWIVFGENSGKYYRLDKAWQGDAQNFMATRNFSPSGLLTLLWGVTKSLRELHSRGIAHRDIKLANILLSEKSATLSDFGMCLGPFEERSRDTEICTHVTRAPEIWNGLEHSLPCDIFSLGCVVFSTIVRENYITRDNRLEALSEIKARQKMSLESFFKRPVCLGPLALLVSACRTEPQDRPDINTISSFLRFNTRMTRPRPISGKTFLNSKCEKIATVFSQPCLSGSMFFPSTEKMRAHGATRASRIFTLDSILEKTSSAKEFFCTLDIFDRLFDAESYAEYGFKAILDLALYIYKIASNSGVFAHQDRAMFWKGLCTLQFELGTKETCTWTALVQCDTRRDARRDMQCDAQCIRRISANYLRWPDGKTSRKEFLDWPQEDEYEKWMLLSK